MYQTFNYTILIYSNSSLFIVLSFLILMYNKNSYLKDISISIYYDKDTYTLFIFYLHQGDNLMNKCIKT